MNTPYLENNTLMIPNTFATGKLDLDKIPVAGDLILHFAANCSAEISSAYFEIKDIDLLVSIFDDVFIDAYVVNNNGLLVCLSDLKHYINDNDLREDNLQDVLNIDF